jgi:hypothetical protein
VNGLLREATHLWSVLVRDVALGRPWQCANTACGRTTSHLTRRQHKAGKTSNRFLCRCGGQLSPVLDPPTRKATR